MQATDSSGSSSVSGVRSPWWRTAVSVLLLVHLVAIFSAPWAWPPPSSQLSRDTAEVFRPYLNAIHQFNGYRFFAPEPGPSHLIRYELEMADGSKVQGRFPDRAQHWPRLLYHRHFMLTEHLNNFYIPDDPAQPAPADALAVFHAYANSYAQHLLHAYDGQRVTLELVRHHIADPDLVSSGVKLDDVRFYETLYTRTYERAIQ